MYPVFCPQLLQVLRLLRLPCRDWTSQAFAEMLSDVLFKRVLSYIEVGRQRCQGKP